MKFEMKQPIFECPYCHEKIEGDYAAYQEHVQVCYEKDMARQKLKNEKEIRLKKLNEDAKKFEEDYHCQLVYSSDVYDPFRVFRQIMAQCLNVRNADSNLMNQPYLQTVTASIHRHMKSGICVLHAKANGLLRFVWNKRRTKSDKVVLDIATYFQ